jgi:hypothetical protein
MNPFGFSAIPSEREQECMSRVGTSLQISLSDNEEGALTICRSGKRYLYWPHDVWLFMRMDKRQNLLRRLEAAWSDFRESYAGLSEEEVLQPGVTGQWSVKDIVAHVTTWEEETLTHLPGVLRGEKYPLYSVKYGGIDAFNALMTAQKKNLSPPEVFRQQDEVHRRLLRFIETVPEELLGSTTRFRHRLRMDTYSHYPKHAAAIRKWRTQFTTHE